MLVSNISMNRQLGPDETQGTSSFRRFIYRYLKKFTATTLDHTAADDDTPNSDPKIQNQRKAELAKKKVFTSYRVCPDRGLYFSVLLSR